MIHGLPDFFVCPLEHGSTGGLCYRVRARQGLDREGVCEKEFVILDNVWLGCISFIIAQERGEWIQLLPRVTSGRRLKPLSCYDSRKLLLHSYNNF
jgi:hypothetical protein